MTAGPWRGRAIAATGFIIGGYAMTALAIYIMTAPLWNVLMIGASLGLVIAGGFFWFAVAGR